MLLLSIDISFRLHREKHQQLETERRQSTELEEQRAKERSRLAQLKYERWFKAKTNQLRRAKSDLSSTQMTGNSRQSLPAAESQRRLIEWEREKLAELKEQRMRREASLARKNLIDSARRELSADAWEQWVHASRNKPKPVPMGKGLDSLRGTNSPHFKNPNEWQSLQVSSNRTQLSQPTQTPQRHGPDYERLERLAQPRRHRYKTSFVPEVKSNQLGLEDDYHLAKLNNSLDSCLLRPHRTPIIWSKTNAQRVREMKRNVPLVETPRELQDDQLEQLRKQQELQNNKVLPRKFQQKRDQLRRKLKGWVEEGKALPVRSHSSSHSLKDEFKHEQKQELRQQQRRAVYVEETAHLQRRLVSLNESRVQRSDDQLQSIAKKPIAPLQRARSIEPKRLLKVKDSKEAQKARPWR